MGIAESEEVFMLAEPDVEENAREMLSGNPGHGIHVIRMESDDAGRGMWHRPLW